MWTLFLQLTNLLVNCVPTMLITQMLGSGNNNNILPHQCLSNGVAFSTFGFSYEQKCKDRGKNKKTNEVLTLTRNVSFTTVRNH